MDKLIQEAAAALSQLQARYGRYGLSIDALIDESPSRISETIPGWMVRSDAALLIWWVAYLHGAADHADVTVRTLLDEYGASIEVGAAA